MYKCYQQTDQHTIHPTNQQTFAFLESLSVPVSLDRTEKLEKGVINVMFVAAHKRTDVCGNASDP